MATAEDYAAWIVKNADKKGTPEFETVAQAYKLAKEPKSGVMGTLKQGAIDAASGLVRGAGSIGSTLLAPGDAIQDAVAGRSLGTLNRQRRLDIDAGLRSLVGANPDSMAYGAGKLASEVGGTAGVGSALAPAFGAVPALASAVKTAGMTAPGLTGLPALATRAAGGAVTGGVSAGLVDPSMVGQGAAIGAVAPGALQLAGKAGQKIGSVVRGPSQTPQLAQAVQEARGAGYVIPPTQAKPTLANRAMEGFAGKLTTAQNASAKNQAVTNDLAATALGLPKGTQITPDLLTNVRQQAGNAYNAIGQAGVVKPGQGYTQALDAIEAPFKQAAQGFPNAKPSPVLDLVESLRSPSFDAASAVAKIKELRSAADDAFRTGNTDVGRASRAGAKALEDAIEAHLQQTGQTQLLQSFRDARQLIAKTYTVEKALNPASGSVDARKLAAELKKGKPLSGELKTAANFGLQFPKASQAVEGMGSLPQTSPLDWGLGALLSAGTANPLGLLGVAGRPAARGAILSPMVQNRLIQSQPNALAQMLANPEISQALLRATPVGLAGGQ